MNTVLMFLKLSSNCIAIPYELPEVWTSTDLQKSLIFVIKLVRGTTHILTD